MNIYLPIAGQSVNALIIIALGGLVGVLSGMFGIGGGFLTTPLLMFYGIPPPVAVASAVTQITGASVSGVMVHMRRGGARPADGGGDDGRRASSARSPAPACSGCSRRAARSMSSSASLYVAPARRDRRADAQGRADDARLGRAARSPPSSRATTAGRPRCRCAGGSPPRASTCRRSRRWRSASPPAS